MNMTEEKKKKYRDEVYTFLPEDGSSMATSDVYAKLSYLGGDPSTVLFALLSDDDRFVHSISGWARNLSYSEKKSVDTPEPKSVGMNIHDAIKAAKEGDGLRRKSWDAGRKMVYAQLGLGRNVTFDDLGANDWEVKHIFTKEEVEKLRIRMISLAQAIVFNNPEIQTPEWIQARDEWMKAREKVQV